MRTEDLVTVIVTTSPSRSDPEVDLIRTTFACLQLAGLDRCRKLLVCDHFGVGKLTKSGEHGGVLVHCLVYPCVKTDSELIFLYSFDFLAGRSNSQLQCKK
jgi:hypothetical protein